MPSGWLQRQVTEDGWCGCWASWALWRMPLERVALGESHLFAMEKGDEWKKLENNLLRSPPQPRAVTLASWKEPCWSSDGLVLWMAVMEARPLLIIEPLTEIEPKPSQHADSNITMSASLPISFQKNRKSISIMKTHPDEYLAMVSKRAKYQTSKTTCSDFWMVMIGIAKTPPGITTPPLRSNLLFFCSPDL